MIGIVVVSHSAMLAAGLKALADQLGSPARLLLAAGVDDPDHPIGTNAIAVMSAIEEADDGSGVLVLMDLGSALLSAETAIRWWQDRGEDPREKLIIFSDGLDVAKMRELFQRFHGRVKASFGWGTLLTNDFRGLVPGDGLAPFSLVCKAVAANGRPTVKLSDNPEKATGPREEIERYKRVFDVGRQQRMDVVV